MDIVDQFGFSVRKDQEIEEERRRKSFTPKVTDDGAVNISAGGTFGTYLDLEGTIRSEAELVTKYRQMALQPEIEKAVNEVVNEAIVVEPKEDTVALDLEDLEQQKLITPKIKDIIVDEFKFILELINFDKHGYDIFKRWYIDGRSYYHIIIDEEKLKEGIKELRYIDPRKIRKIREIKKSKDPKTGVIMQQTKAEYYIFNEKGLNTNARAGTGFGSAQGTSGLKIKKDSIIHTTSGLMDQNNSMVLSYLHSGIKFLNQLRALEDASLIYHLSRAPERRVFRVEVGNLPRHKAEQHVQDMMTKHKNKLSYNQTTGEVSDQRKFMHMLEDYWLPTRDGRGTQIDVLQGGTQLGQLLESVQYFQDRLYKALQVPLTRLKPDAVYNIGRSSEISRDEINFNKFILRVRAKFSEFFVDALGKQLILKTIIDPENWDLIKNKIKFSYNSDTYWNELKESELLNERFIRLRDIDQSGEYVGKYYSAEWVRKNILRMSDEDIKEEDEKIAAEANNPQYHPELLQPAEPPGEPNAPPPNKGNKQ